MVPAKVSQNLSRSLSYWSITVFLTKYMLSIAIYVITRMLWLRGQPPSQNSVVLPPLCGVSFLGEAIRKCLQKMFTLENIKIFFSFLLYLQKGDL